MRDTTLLGRKRGLLLALGFGCVAAILLLALAHRVYRPSVDQVSSDDEVYKVYSAAIKELLLKRGGAELSTTLVVIKDQTVSYRWEGWNDPTKRTQGWASVGFNPDHNQAFLYVQVVCGNRCGKGFYVLLDRDGGTWSVQHADVLCVS